MYLYCSPSCCAAIAKPLLVNPLLRKLVNWHRGPLESNLVLSIVCQSRSPFKGYPKFGNPLLSSVVDFDAGFVRVVGIIPTLMLVQILVQVSLDHTTQNVEADSTGRLAVQTDVRSKQDRNDKSEVSFQMPTPTMQMPKSVTVGEDSCHFLKFLYSHACSLHIHDEVLISSWIRLPDWTRQYL